MGKSNNIGLVFLLLLMVYLYCWNAVCEETRTHGVEEGETWRQLKRDTYYYSSITIGVTAEDIRGGEGNKLWGQYFHDSQMSLKLTD